LGCIRIESLGTTLEKHHSKKKSTRKCLYFGDCATTAAPAAPASEAAVAAVSQRNSGGDGVKLKIGDV